MDTAWMMAFKPSACSGRVADDAGKWLSGGANGFQAVQMAFRRCKWLSGGANGFQAVQMAFDRPVPVSAT